MSNLLNKFAGFCALLAFSPLMLSIAALIFSIDGGPIFFYQKRLGFKKRTFSILKFRTLRDGAVTKTGKWLRATGLDELPQLINIAKGDMNVVGPRPITKEDHIRFGYNGREHLRRWVVKPGLTGLSQIRGGITAKHSWNLDRAYIAMQSPLLDLILIAITLLVNIGGKRIIRKLLSAHSNPFLLLGSGTEESLKQ